MDTTSGAKKSWGSRATLAIGLLLMGVVAAAALYIVLGGGASDDLVEMFNAHSIASRDAVYTRPEPPPALPQLEEGSAAEAYKDAWRHMEARGAPPTAFKDHAFTAISSAIDPSLPPPDKVSRSSAELTDCAGASWPPSAATDPVVRSLTPELCAWLEGASDAEVSLRLGTRRVSRRSPLHIWDGWASENAAQYRSLLPFLTLAKVHLLKGYLRSLEGDLAAFDAAMVEVIQFGIDLIDGAGLLGAMLGSAITNLSADLLTALLGTETGIDEPRARALSTRLSYVMRHVPTAHDMFVAEFLQVTPSLIEKRTDDLVMHPTHFDYGSLSSGGVLETAFVADFRRDYLDMFRAYLDLEGTSLAERVVVYSKWEERFAKKLNPLHNLASPGYVRYDARLIVTMSRLGMLQIALADVVYRHLHSSPPPSLDALEALELEVPVDRITNEPFVLLPEQGTTERRRVSHSEEAWEVVKLHINKGDEGARQVFLEPPHKK